MVDTKIDLHVHSNISDGEYSIKELVDIAKKRKIKAIAITDHDKFKVTSKDISYAKKKGVELVPGIELTVTPLKNCRELHIVGLFIKNNWRLEKNSMKNKKFSIRRAKKIIKKLNKLNYDISFEDLMKEGGGKHLGRPTIAKILLRKYPSKFKDSKDIFNKLLGTSGKAFVKAKSISLRKAIKLIHNSGGIAILAHPWYLRENMEDIVFKFKKFNGDGIEANCDSKTSIPSEIKKLLRKVVMENKTLLVSGGTDFHKIKKNGLMMGEEGITNEEFEKLKKYGLRKN